MTISSVIEQFIQHYMHLGYIQPIDRIYKINEVLHLIGENEYTDSLTSEFDVSDDIDDVIDALCSKAIDNGVITDTQSQKEALSAKLMNVMTPLPSVVNEQFHKQLKNEALQATNQFYQLVCDNGYIQQKAIAKNVQFMHPCDYGDLQITINLSKPEKDPKDIALALTQPKSNYPETLLTMTNEGYYGTSTHPARSNHRVVRLQLNGEAFGFQYSPYAYFDEHCIVFSEHVHPMHIDETTIRQLLTVLDMMPHYTFGSNADLPIVGGSILSHHHFQGGRFVFPMEKASVKEVLNIGVEGVSAYYLNWPLSVIRLTATDKEQLIAAYKRVHDTWQNYSDESCDILSHTQDELHNTVTPIVRYKNDAYELDVVLRNNRTTPQRPDGLFHPRQEYHHIKKENIGLIEVMGLAILPGRLKAELEEVKKYLLKQPNAIAAYHKDWADTLDINNLEDIELIIQRGVGDVFKKVLEDAAVFKQDKTGQEGLLRFVEAVRKGEF